jgi:hypothetical protein
MFRASPSRPDVSSEVLGGEVTDLLNRASAILAREGARLPAVPMEAPDSVARAVPGVANQEALPAPRAQSFLPGLDPDRLRRMGHEIIESLLAAVVQPGSSVDSRVPLLQCVAAVQAGHDGVATLRVNNDEAAPSEVTLYCTNFVADTGCDIPSLRVTFLPRSATVAAKSEAVFEIKIAVPQQARPGVYSGLIQAMGARYAKAVLSVEVM